MSEPVIVSVEQGVGIIELARPAKFNALSRRTVQLLGEALSAFEGNTEVRSLLIRAQGPNFCTGADLEELGALNGDGASAGGNAERLHAVMDRLEASPLPVIVAVQGLCLAGGLELMLAGDVVLAGASARIGDQHARYGLIPGGGASQRLPRLIGLRRSLDLFFSARWIDAATAEQWGLVNKVVPDEQLQAAALEYGVALAKRNRHSIALMKSLAREGLDGTLAAGLASERAAVPGVLASPDVQEGLAAFLERREPKFS